MIRNRLIRLIKCLKQVCILIVLFVDRILKFSIPICDGFILQVSC